MGEAKHTQGDWAVREGRTHFAEVVTTDSRSGIVVVARIPTPQTQATVDGRKAEASANAALIAAAPLMLEALKAVHFDCGVPDCTACAAIAKAESAGRGGMVR